MMQRVDLRQEHIDLYRPSAREVAIVDVPELPFLMIDGQGDPSGPAFAAATEALYSVSYALKFLLKPLGLDSAVMPLEGLWWADDMAAFHLADREAWRWTAMIAQPAAVTPDLVELSRAQVWRRRPLVELGALRFERYHEGLAAQIMHIGPYAAEAPTIIRMHTFIQQHGYALRGKHHEIYLSDPRRAAPARMRTVLRQPIG